MTPKLLPGMNVAQVHLHHRKPHANQRVAESDGIVGKRSGIDHNGFGPLSMLLNGIDEAIKKIPNMTFREPSNATALRNSLTQETQTVIGNIATLLKLDQLDTAISKLTDLKIKLYSSLGGNSLNGMTANNTMQQSPIYLINNLIQVLEKQK